MKTTKKLKWAIVALLFVGFAACKKDKTAEPTPDPVKTEILTIAQLKALSTGNSITIAKENTIYKIKGVVISDNSATGKNIDEKTAVLTQDNNSGIVVNFSSAHSFLAGTEVEIGVSNQKLEKVNGEIVLNSVALDSTKIISTEKSISPRETTIAEILDKQEVWNGTLVKIDATELTGSNGNYEGTLTIVDKTGELKSEIRAQAGFSGNPYPVSVSSITGILRISGNNTRVDIRKAADVVVGDYSRIEVEDFENITGDDPEGSLYFGLRAQFITTFSEWHAGGWVMKYLGSRFDASFLTSDREYIYQYSSIPKDYASIPNFGYSTHGLAVNKSIEGLRKINIRFAGSNANEWFYAPSHTQAIIPFDPAVDRVMIGVYPAYNHNGTRIPIANNLGEIFQSLIVYSTEYKKTGEWFEFAYTIPTREELLTAGVPASVIDLFLDSPSFSIVNYSTRGGTTGDSNGPIIFDKVTFYY